MNRYTIRFARFTSRGWNTNGPWMRLLVTNRRLVFLPNDLHSTTGEYLIDRLDVRRCWNAAMGRRNGIILELCNGELIHMYVEWAQGNKLVKDIREMLAQPVQPRIAPRLPDKPLIN